MEIYVIYGVLFIGFIVVLLKLFKKERSAEEKRKIPKCFNKPHVFDVIFNSRMNESHTEISTFGICETIFTIFFYLLFYFFFFL